jgi:hypothetical protein
MPPEPLEDISPSLSIFARLRNSKSALVSSSPFPFRLYGEFRSLHVAESTAIQHVRGVDTFDSDRRTILAKAAVDELGVKLPFISEIVSSASAHYTVAQTRRLGIRDLGREVPIPIPSMVIYGFGKIILHKSFECAIDHWL